jgi:uncharacterized cupin superfamily protein
MEEFGTNIWAELDELGDGVRGKRLQRPRGATLAHSVWELDPGAGPGDYHFHHGSEETLIVLRGRPTLRTPEGERELEEGEVVHFARGPDGAHSVANRSGETVRFVMAAAHPTPEVIEYPDRGTFVVMARTASQAGGPLFSFHRLADAVDRDEDTGS